MISGLKLNNRLYVKTRDVCLLKGSDQLKVTVVNVLLIVKFCHCCFMNRAF